MTEMMEDFTEDNFEESKNADTTVDCDEPESMRKMFIGRLDFNTTEETFRKYFEKWGTIVDAVVMMKDPKTKKSRGFGFVTFSKSSMVDAVQNARPHEIDGRTIETKRAVPREDVDRPDLSATVKKIYVGGLEEDHDDEAMREYFGRFGKIVNINIVNGKGPNPRRYGFVEFDDYDPVDKIVLQKTHPIKGKLVNVKKSLPKDENGGGGGGRKSGGQQRFGGGGGGGGGGNRNNSNWGNGGGGNFNDGFGSFGGGGGGGGSRGGNWGGFGGGGGGGGGFNGNQSNFGGGGGGGFGNGFGMNGPVRNNRRGGGGGGGTRGGPYGNQQGMGGNRRRI